MFAKSLFKQSSKTVQQLEQTVAPNSQFGGYIKYFDKKGQIYKSFKKAKVAKEVLKSFGEKQWNYYKQSGNRAQFEYSSQFSLALLGLPLFVIMNQKFSKVACFFGFQKHQSNNLQNRVVTLQYAANNPIEDRVHIKQLKEIDGFLLEVYDGHGGWQVSQFAYENLANELEKVLKENKEKQFQSHDDYIQESIVQAFDEVENKFLNIARNAYNIGFGNVSKVGSCALIALVHNNKIYSANIGDCKGVIISENPAGEFTHQKINHKLNANSKKEQARLKQAFQNEPDIITCNRGNDACYVKSRLQPTRAFGDLQLKYQEFNNPKNEPSEKGFPSRIPNFTGPYITHKPEIQVFDLTADSRFLVMGSDGLWDELSKNDVTKIAMENRTDKAQLIDQLFKQSFQKVSEDCKKPMADLRNVPLGTRRMYHDDISIIVVELQNQYKEK